MKFSPTNLNPKWFYLNHKSGLIAITFFCLLWTLASISLLLNINLPAGIAHCVITLPLCYFLVKRTYYNHKKTIRLNIVTEINISTNQVEINYLNKSKENVTESMDCSLLKGLYFVIIGSKGYSEMYIEIINTSNNQSYHLRKI